jgi:hypothetical protein
MSTAARGVAKGRRVAARLAFVEVCAALLVPLVVFTLLVHHLPITGLLYAMPLVLLATGAYAVVRITSDDDRARGPRLMARGSVDTSPGFARLPDGGRTVAHVAPRSARSPSDASCSRGPRAAHPRKQWESPARP